MRLRKFLAAILAFVSVLAFASPVKADAIRDREYWLSDYGFTEAWKISKGGGVKVAIIDTGIDDSHPDLIGALVDGTDVSGIGNSFGSKPVGEVSHHGTMVASLLAGRGHSSNGSSRNDSGVIGVAPEAQLLSVSMAFGKPNFDTDEQIARGIRWAVDAGAQVINLSLTRNSKDWPLSWDEAFLYAFENDVVVVAAAGNRANGLEQVGAPATIPGVLVVAGVDKNAKASFDASSSGLSIAVAAPATDLVSAYPEGDYKIWTGSSGAAPIVSGLVALVRSRYPDLDANNVINRIIRTATKPTDDNFSVNYGFGLINPSAALNDKVSQVDENPLGSLSEWVELYRGASDPIQDASKVVAGGIEIPSGSKQLSETSGFSTTEILPIGVYLVLGVLVLFSWFRRLQKLRRRN